MKRLTSILLAFTLLMGCHTHPQPTSGNSAMTPADTALKNEREIDDYFREKYAKEYQPWLCDKNELPVVTTFDVEDGTSMLVLSRALHLRLHFGKVLDPDGNHRDYRTETRYTLITPPGNELGTAEGKLGGEAPHPFGGQLQVRFTPETQCVEMEEAFSGVGDRFRQIVFLPEAGSPLDANGVPTQWKTFHLKLPLREATAEDSDPGKIHGVSHGKIYVEVDGHFYAFPVEKFAVTDLSFQMG